MKRVVGHRLSVFRRRGCRRSISHLPLVRRSLGGEAGTSIFFPRLCRRAAFTLVEVIIAMGVLTISLVGILALFPVAFDTARESAYETRVAFIAETILADIKATATATPGSESPPVPPSYQSKIFLNDLSQSVDLDLDQANADAYFSVDLEGQLTDSIEAAQFNSGVDDAGFIARVSALYNTPAHPGLTEIRILVEAPGVAPATNRKSYTFVTLISLP